MPGADLASAGQRLEDYVRFHLPRAPFASDGKDGRHRDTIAELCRQAGITRNTWYGWTKGDTAPTGAPMRRVAQALGRPEAELWAAYNGEELAPPTIEDAVLRLVDAQREQNERMDALLTRLDAIANAAIQEAVRRALDEVSRYQAEAGTPAPSPRRARARAAGSQGGASG